MRAEIDAARQFAHDEKIDAVAENRALQRTRVRERAPQLDGPQIAREPQSRAQAEQRALRTPRTGQAVPLRTADRAQKDGVGRAAAPERRVRQRLARRVDRRVDVLFDGARKRRDDGGRNGFGNAADALEVAGGRDGESGFDDVDAEKVELFGQAGFLVERHRIAGGLLPVAQGRVENRDTIVGSVVHFFFLLCGHEKKQPRSCGSEAAFIGWISVGGSSRLQRIALGRKAEKKKRGKSKVCRHLSFPSFGWRVIYSFRFARTRGRTKKIRFSGRGIRSRRSAGRSIPISRGRRWPETRKALPGTDAATGN